MDRDPDKLIVKKDDRGRRHYGCLGRIADDNSATTDTVVGVATGLAPCMVIGQDVIWTGDFAQEELANRRPS